MGAATLTSAQVIRLRVAASKGAVYTKLAEQYSLHATQISKIVRGINYVDIGGPLTTRKLRSGKKHRRRVPAVRKKKQATVVDISGRLRAPDLPSMSVDDASRFLQALSAEWPKIKASFELLDRMIMGDHDEE